MPSRRRPRPTRTSTPSAAFTVAALPLLLHRRAPAAGAAHVPFGWQSDSRRSVEFRDSDPSSDPDSRGPSAYAGAARYDPLHHALYLTGATFASAVFDGVDVFALTTEEEEQTKDGKADNGGYWWDDAGPRPQLEDPGVPDHAPEKGDCFYAVLGLPNPDDPSFPRDQNEVKLVHSRRFGSEGVAEACSAVDVLPASPSKGAPGGYLHEFEEDGILLPTLAENSSGAPTPADSGDSQAVWLYGGQPLPAGAEDAGGVDVAGWLEGGDGAAQSPAPSPPVASDGAGVPAATAPQNTGPTGSTGPGAFLEINGVPKPRPGVGDAGV